MSLSVQIGLLLALGTAFASVLGFLYKHRGAVESPAVELRRPVRTSLALFRSRWYVLGIVVAMASWGLHVGALALAPISLVQSVIAGGLVLLTVTADRLFAHEVTRREWIGVALAALGLAFLAATLDGAGRDAHSDCGGGAPGPLRRRARGRRDPGRRRQRRQRPRRGSCSGSRRASTGRPRTPRSRRSPISSRDGAGAVLLDPLAAVIALASFAGLVVSARSLQIGKAVPVIAVTSVAANAFTIAAGPIVFAEPLPDDALGLVVRMSAFCLVIVAAALTPAPVKAAHLEAS